MESTPSRPSRAQVATSSSGRSSGDVGSDLRVQLKQGLRGLDFAQQEELLTPVQAKRAGSAVQRDTPRGGSGTARGGARSSGRASAPTETMDFSDEAEVIEVDTFDLGSRRPYDVIQDHVNGCAMALQQLKDNELGAIEQFMTHMAFSSSDEAEPDVLGTIFSEVFETLASAALGSFGEVGGLSLGDLVGVVTAVSDELARAAAARGSFNTAAYITQVRGQVTNTYTSAIANLMTKGPELDRRFTDRGVGEDRVAWTEGQRTVTGEQAAYLRGLEQEKNDLLGRVGRTPLIAYEERFLSRWVTSNSAGGEGIQDLGFFGGGYVSNGEIRAKFNSSSSGGRSSFAFQEAKLYVTAKAGNAADMINRVMAERGKKVWELGIPVIVGLYGPNLVGGSGYSWFRVEGAPDPNTTSSGPSEMEERWAQFVDQNVLDRVTNVDGG